MQEAPNSLKLPSSNFYINFCTLKILKPTNKLPIYSLCCSCFNNSTLTFDQNPITFVPSGNSANNSDTPLFK